MTLTSVNDDQVRSNASLQFYSEVELCQDFALSEGDLGAMLRLPVYHAEVTLFDEKMVTQADHEIEIWTTKPAKVQIENQTYDLDSETSCKVRTNGHGKIRAEIAGKNISAPELLFYGSFMEEEKRVLVRPSAAIQERFEIITAENLKNARNYDGELIVDEDVRQDTKLLDAMAGTMRSTMTMTRASKIDSIAVGNHCNDYCCDDCDPACVCCVNAGDAHCTTVCTQNYAFSLRDNTRKQEIGHWELNDAETTQWLLEHPLDSDAANWWTWEDIKSGVVKIADAVVYVAEKVTEGVQVVVTVIVKEAGELVQRIGRLVVETIEEAFVLIESIFDAVVTSIDDLLEWISYVFDWKKVVEAHNKIHKFVNDGLKKLGTTTAFDDLETQISTSIDSVKQNVDAYFDALAEKVGTQSNNEREAAVNAQRGKANSASGGVRENFLFAKTTDNAFPPVTTTGEAAVSALFPPFVPSDELLLAMSGLATMLSTAVSEDVLATIKEVTSAFKPASSAQELLSEAATAFIAAVKGAIDVLLDIISAFATGAIEVLKAMLSSEALTAWLNAEIKIPYVSALYCRLTGDESMSTLGLASLLAAFPGVLFGVFDDDTKGSLESDNDEVSASVFAGLFQMLAGLFGLVKTKPGQGKDVKLFQLFFVCLARVAFAIGIIGARSGAALLRVLLIWLMPTINWMKDLAGVCLEKSDDAWKTLSDAISTVLGVCSLVFLIVALVSGDLTPMGIAFVAIVTISLLIGSLHQLAAPGVREAVPAVRTMMIFLSGVVAIIGAVVDVPRPGLHVSNSG